MNKRFGYFHTLGTKKPWWRHTLFVSLFIAIGGAILFWWFSLPHQLFEEDYSTVMYDRNGNLLNARVAADEQWRFQSTEAVPEKFEKALLTFEDRYFYYHPGFNALAMVRATYQNIRAGRVVSGGSTLSMQLIRLHRGSSQRNIQAKLVEVFLSLRLEARYSKSQILRLYAGHAPFGGNVVGLEAASWRYFGHGQHQLSWAEAATLAVLPNSPALIFPGRNEQRLLEKRNALLLELHERGYMDALTLSLAKSEPLPGRPYPLPQKAPQLFSRAAKDGFSGKQLQTSLDQSLQMRVGEIMQSYYLQYRGNHIHNMAVLVAEVQTGEVLVYQGNVPFPENSANRGHQVDIIGAPRSPGSLLKPFLYAAMLQDGAILPNSLVADIPSRFTGFSPQNFTRTYDGAVPASMAIARSLNIPAVRLLQEYHPEKFLSVLRRLGMNGMDKSAAHYGLSMILGSGELSMWEMAGAYTAMAQSLMTSPESPWEKSRGLSSLTYLNEREDLEVDTPEELPFSRDVIWLTFQAMVQAARPDTEIFSRTLGFNQNIAWKTGTSYGYRDAWSIGLSSQYVVAVWVGNASGEGRPGLTGIAAAAPLMFEVFRLLPSSPSFPIPYDDLKEMIVCTQSGHPYGRFCENKDTIWVPNRESGVLTCPYHKRIFVDEHNERVNASCATVGEMRAENYFVLPPVQEYYYKRAHISYRTLPPWRADCGSSDTSSGNMQWIFPIDDAELFIPIELDGSAGETIFKIAHRYPGKTVYWHLNHEFLGSTVNFHEMGIRPPAGRHTLTLTDEDGHFLQKKIWIRSP